MSSSSAHTIIQPPPPELPNEILLLIIQRCPRVTLKNVRLSSKNLAHMAEPYLWREVVFVPNDSCILGFIKALKRSKITRHVTKLVYDARFGQFFSHLKTYPPDPGVEWPADDKAQTEALLDRVSQGRFYPYEDMALEVAMLSKALRILPNLREIRVRDYEESPNAVITKIPQFYQKLCRLSKVDPEKVDFTKMIGSNGRSYTKGIMTAAFSAGLRLQSLKSKNLDARAFFGVVPMKSSAAYQQLCIFQSVMDSLRVLELSFRNASLMSTANHIDCVQSLLKSAKKLKTLTLRLTDYTITRYQYPDDELSSELSVLLESSTGTWLSRPLLPRLENLTIDACICHSEDLIHFLKIHSATLRRLEMSNITLLGGEDRRECWVQLIKHFKSYLQLSHVSFSGWLTNGGRQHWFVAKDNVSEGRLKAKVERYIVDKRIPVCPLEPLAIQANQSDVVKPANGKEWEGDITWTMIYASRMGGDPMDWQLTVPVFGAPAPGDSDPSSAAGDDIQSVTSEFAPESWEHFDNEPTVVVELEPQNFNFGDYIPVGSVEKKKKPKKKKSKSTFAHWGDVHSQSPPISYTNSTPFYSTPMAASPVQTLNTW